MDRQGLREVIKAVEADDLERARRFLADSTVRHVVNDTIGPFDSPAINHVKSREMLDVLLEAGADINARSTWWAGGFGLLDLAAPDIAAYAIERGATVDAHAAARLGLVDVLERLLAADRSLVHAPGGDGQTPLHMASTVEAADMLIGAGADLDARDVDHESTPAQYMVRDRQEVARHLVSRGCRTDLLMTAALGDVDRTRRHLDNDAACIEMRVNDRWFPKTNPHAGGTIYNWTLDSHASAHQVAKRFGHTDVLQLLFERTAPVAKVAEACLIEDEAAARGFRAAVPSLAEALSADQRRLIAHAARNNQTRAVALMLESGWPVDARGQHEGTPLHWAGFHGNLEMAREILRFNPPLEATDRDFKATPLGWTIYGSENGWYVSSGKHAETVELLLRAGAIRPPAAGGNPAVREVLQRKS
ncbi:MAG: ankyrin repeat domain-containing protein [Vicinamibacterales bacterium]